MQYYQFVGSHRKQQVWMSLHVLYVTELWNNKQE